MVEVSWLEIRSVSSSWVFLGCNAFWSVEACEVSEAVLWQNFVYITVERWCKKVADERQSCSWILRSWHKRLYTADCVTHLHRNTYLHSSCKENNAANPRNAAFIILYCFNNSVWRWLPVFVCVVITCEVAFQGIICLLSSDLQSSLTCRAEHLDLMNKSQTPEGRR